MSGGDTHKVMFKEWKSTHKQAFLSDKWSLVKHLCFCVKIIFEL